MYRVTFTYCNSSIGNAYDDDCDLDYRFYESQDITYVYKNLDYDSLRGLLEKEISDLKRVKNGEISISLMVDE